MPSDLLSGKFKTSASVTDTGKKRENNEDCVLVLENAGCYAVSDGMGGGAAGEIASSTVITYIRNAVSGAPVLPETRRERFREAVYAAHNAIRAYAEKKEYHAMGATLAALLLNPWDPSTADIYHAGDSRVYRLRGKRLECLTADHTVGNTSGLPEHQLPKGMSGLLSNVVGIPSGFFLANTAAEIRKNDVFLICSDGLYRQVPETEMTAALQKENDLKAVLASWVAYANEREGIDNLSAIVIRFGALPGIYVPSAEEIQQNQQPDPDIPSASDAEQGETIL